MNACEIVSLLLEADEPSGGDRTGVYIFGPKLPKEGYMVKDIMQAVTHFREIGVVPKDTPNSTEMVDRLVNTGYTFFIKHDPGNIEVIGNRLPITTTPEGVEQVCAYLGLQPDSQVATRKHTQDSVKATNISQILHGVKAQAPAAALAHPAAAKPAVKKQTVPQPPKRQNMPAGQEFTPIESPVSLGFTFDRGSQEGIIIKEVHPGGPSAQAGLQAGDVLVQTGEFLGRDGETVGPFYIAQQKHLEYVLRHADPTYAVPFRIHRGGREVWLPIQPVAKAAEQPAAQPAAAATPAPPSAVERMVPNEPNPTRETGNLPPNVSSLT